MFHKFTSRLDIRGTLETVTPIRIGAGRSSSPVGSDLPVVKDVFGRPYIPGSSFKGVLRSYVESIMRGITDNRRIVCDPTSSEQQCITKDEMEELRRRRDLERWTDQKFSDEILKRTCWVCQLFGSPWLASRCQIRDLNVIEESWFDQYQQRDGVAIDRDTETVSGGKLYDYEVVPAGVLFDFRAIVDNAEEWQLGMLYIGLRAFENEMLTIGGGVSRGLGSVRLELSDQYFMSQPEVVKFLSDPQYRGELANPERWINSFTGKLQGEM